MKVGNDFDFVIKNYYKNLNIAAKANKRKTKILNIMSNNKNIERLKTVS